MYNTPIDYIAKILCSVFEGKINKTGSYNHLYS